MSFCLLSVYVVFAACLDAKRAPRLCRSMSQVVSLNYFFWRLYRLAQGSRQRRLVLSFCCWLLGNDARLLVDAVRNRLLLLKDPVTRDRLRNRPALVHRHRRYQRMRRGRRSRNLRKRGLLRVHHLHV